MKSLRTCCLLAILIMGSSKANAQTEVTFYTSMGSFKVMLTDTLTPITVDSFLARVDDKFYDGTIFHRVIDNFMIQGGDPLGTGFGGPGYTIPDEFHPSLKNIPKALAMANSGPNTGGSQFFINLVTNNHLNNKHTVFGMVSTNFNVVQDIGHVPVNASNKPLTDVVLDSIRITAFPADVSHLGISRHVGPFPNPTKGVFRLEVGGGLTTVEVFDMTGKLIYHASTRNRLDIDMQDQARGCYLVRLVDAKGVSERKLVLE